MIRDAMMTYSVLQMDGKMPMVPRRMLRSVDKNSQLMPGMP